MNDAGSDVVEELVEGPGEKEVQEEKTHEEQAALIKGVLQGDEDANGDSEGDADGDVELAPLFVLELVLELAVPLLLGQFEGQYCGQAQAQSQVQTGAAEGLHGIRGRGVIPMHPGGHCDVEGAEHDQSEQALLEEELGHCLEPGGLHQLGHPEQHSADEELGQEKDVHDVEVVEEEREQVQLPDHGGQLGSLLTRLDVEAVEGLEGEEGREVEIEDLVVGQAEVGQLQQPEQLQPGDLDAHQRGEQNDVAADLNNP